MIIKKVLVLVLIPVFFGAFLSCESDDNVVSEPMEEEMPMETASNEFTVTIENVIETKDYLSSGGTGFLMPGESASYTFNAGMGQRLSFVTMYVQSNDLFFGFEEDGIALYDDEGMAVTGDVTAFVDLWDAGTEVNEEPGVGTNQAPRQSEAGMGTEENGTVGLIEDSADGFTYPAVAELIKVGLSHDGGTEFTLTLENSSGGSAIPSPLAPGVWVVHSAEQTPLFVSGEAASEGLEDIAEDGNNDISLESLDANSGFVSPYAPGAYDVGDNTLFVGAAAEAALEALAEDGDPSGFTNVFNTPVGASEPGPLFPGGSYSFTFMAEEGDKLSFTTMLVQSNDWFVGVDAIDLYSNGGPLSGDITAMVNLYDAGTEVDQYAGAGSNQPLRQSGPNTGEDENSTVEIESEAGAHVPSVSGLVKVTISAN